MNKYFKILTLLLISTIISITYAATPGVILVANGSAQILDKSKKIGKTLSYRGQKFYYQKLKLGQKVFPGQFVKCDPGCKVKIGFPNGDSIFVGPGTTMEIPKISKTEKNINHLELFYGKIRAIISSKGPRKKLKIRTRSAVTGVRGTDLFVSYNDYAGHHTSVVRGEVQISPITESFSPKSKAAAKPKIIKSGEVASIKAEKPIIESRKINRSELKDIQKMAETKPETEALKELPIETQAEMAQLEKKSHEVVVEDIREHNPEALKNLPKDEPITSDVLNEVTIASLFDKAPEGKVEWEQKTKIETEIETETPKAVSQNIAETPHWANKIEMTLVFNRYQDQGPQLPGGKSLGARAAWNPRLFTLGSNWSGEAFIGLTPTVGTVFDHEGGEDETFYSKEGTLAIDFGLRFKYQPTWYFISLGLIGSSTNVTFGGMEVQLGMSANFLPKLDSIAISVGGLDWNEKRDHGGEPTPALQKDPIMLDLFSLNSFWSF